MLVTGYINRNQNTETLVHGPIGRVSPWQDSTWRGAAYRPSMLVPGQLRHFEVHLIRSNLTIILYFYFADNNPVCHTYCTRYPTQGYLKLQWQATTKSAYGLEEHFGSEAASHQSIISGHLALYIPGDR